MQKIRTLIIEDEKPAARKLERMLSSFPELDRVATLHSVQEGINWFQNNEAPDLIFADIVLGDGLSFDIFEKTAVKSFLIYTTAFDQYTLRAFKLNSVDYLLKPVIMEDLSSAIQKFKSFLPERRPEAQVDYRSMIRQEKPALSRILVKIGHNMKLVYTPEINCFYSQNKIVYLQTQERSYPTDFTLDELENILNAEHFFRVNRQFIISEKWIKNIHTSPVYKVQLEYQPEEEIIVSRDRLKDFKDWLSK